MEEGMTVERFLSKWTGFYSPSDFRMEFKKDLDALVRVAKAEGIRMAARRMVSSDSQAMLEIYADEIERGGAE